MSDLPDFPNLVRSVSTCTPCEEVQSIEGQCMEMCSRVFDDIIKETTDLADVQGSIQNALEMVEYFFRKLFEEFEENSI